MYCSMPGFPVLHPFPKLTLMSIESVMPSNHLILCQERQAVRIWDAWEVEKLIHVWPLASHSFPGSNGLCLLIACACILLVFSCCLCVLSAWGGLVPWRYSLSAKTLNKDKLSLGISLVVQWLRFCASTIGGAGWPSGQETKITHLRSLHLEHKLLEAKVAFT